MTSQKKHLQMSFTTLLIMLLNWIYKYFFNLYLNWFEFFSNIFIIFVLKLYNLLLILFNTKNQQGGQIVLPVASTNSVIRTLLYGAIKE